MQIISGTTQFKIPDGTAVAIGKFDGLHLGHRKLLDMILRQKEDGLKAAVFTFDPSPEVFFGMNPSRELSTNKEKRELFREIGIDILVEFPFNKETAAISPEDFVIDILVNRMNAKYVAAGTDLSFGAKGKGNFAMLSSLARHLGFETCKIDKIERNGKVISSTLIRGLVEEGNMEEAAACLGAPYKITGKIVHGKALGRRIGIPTLNQMPPSDKLLPPFGVYYSEVKTEGGIYKGITNIGIKPTVTNENRVTVETSLYDFSGDLYGETAEVSLLTFRRPEMRFSGIAELKKTMEKDIRAGEIYHGLKQID
ncbi:MAG: bifunctional riboflavin kinase/FAD synthetase [Lachnospiraceae bacterium]|nr:bifunctional riboflavin kinase/FAD synthetase [Lachnospiraceae bacterium]MBQ8329940.1 bifunctional riboflavin kinase/FAD synthetase [Lachnospiraceae bacterium]